MPEPDVIDETANKTIDKGIKTVSKVAEKFKLKFEQLTREKTMIYAIIGFIVLLVILVFYWLFRISGLDDSNCKKMNDTYKKINTSITNINENTYNMILPKTGKLPSIRDFYIKTAYNCCSTGFYKGDFVNKCGLKQCIKQGVRCLDFEIYSYNNKPVIAVSSIKKNTTKQSYNTLNFNTIMKMIRDYSFSDGYSPCSTDPLFLHFRIMSKNKHIYKEMKESIVTYLNDYLLSSNYSYEFHGKNITEEPLMNFKKKIIIMVNNDNKTYLDTPLAEFVNASTGTNYININNYSQGTVFSSTPDEVILQNKRGMTFIAPDRGYIPDNPNPVEAMDNYGCQFVAMCFQKYDGYLENYIERFEKERSAFIIQPNKFLFVPNLVKLDTLKPQGAIAEVSTKEDILKKQSETDK